jgi:hypothetical protein
MLKHAAVPLLGVVGVVALVAVSGCAGRTPAEPSASVSAPADVGGTWIGALQTGAPVTMVLEQAGPDVKGTLQVPGRPDISGPIEGKVECNNLKLMERSGFGRAPLLNVRGDQITGFVAGTTLDLRRSR